MRSKYEVFLHLARKHGLHLALFETGEHFLSYLPRKGIPYYYRLRAWYNWKRSGDFQYRPSPYKIVWINPNTIVHNSGKRFSYLFGPYRDSGKVVGGDWDKNLERFGKTTIFESDEPENTVYKSFQLHFEEGFEWTDTPFIQKVLKQIDEGQTIWHGCSSHSDVLERCEEFDRIYAEIESVGYKSRQQLIEEHSPSLTNPTWFKRAYDEVVVNIGGDGDFLFVGGHHRLSLAKILGVDNIPVRIFIRHKEWQRKFDKIYLGEESPQTHPDLIEVKPP